MRILVIHGPNLNILGKRDVTKYGSATMQTINDTLSEMALESGIQIEFFQSNHEGSIIDFLQRDASRTADGTLLNPGALIRYAYSLRQALIDFKKPVMEIHMSNITKRGVNISVNVLDDVRVGYITGLKEYSYYEGFLQLVEYIEKH